MHKQIYFSSQAQALEAATDRAQAKGFVVGTIPADHVAYETTRKYHVELTKEEKLQKKMLHISLYRMPSGSYELTDYIG
jgi:hypothetical protein